MLKIARRTALILLCWALVNALAQIKASPRPVAHIRVNQVGYTNGQMEKRAIILSNIPLKKTSFSVVDLNGSTVYTASVGKRVGKWNVDAAVFKGNAQRWFGETRRSCARGCFGRMVLSWFSVKWNFAFNK